MRELGDNVGKEYFFEVVRLEARRENWDSSRNSTLDLKKYEDGGGTSKKKRSVITDEGELWVGEDGAVGEDMRDTRSKKGGSFFLQYLRENMKRRKRRKNKEKV